MKQAAKSPTSPSGAASKTPVALGFRAHSGWAALVAVAGSPRPACPPIEPLVIDRRRIELARAGVPVQPYHAAAELELKQAAELIARCAQEACELAREALLGRVAQLRQKGYDVVGCDLWRERVGTKVRNCPEKRKVVRVREEVLLLLNP